MAVLFVGAGAVVSGIDALSVPWPGSQSAGDVALLLLETNETDTVSVSGWTELSSSPQAYSTLTHKLSVFWSVAAGSDANVSIADPGNHGIAQILVFSGVDGVAPINVTGGTSLGISSVSVTCTGVTTTVNDCGVVHIVGTGRDANTTAQFDGWANSNLASITEIADVTTGNAGGGGFGAAWGILALAGATGDGTVTQAISSVYTTITVALAPASAGSSSVYSDFSDAYVIRAAASSDLSDSYSIRAAVLSDLLDSYLILYSAIADLSDSHIIRASIAAELADSYEIISAGVVTSDLIDAYVIRASSSADLYDSYSIRAAVLSDLADHCAVRVAVASDLSDASTIIVYAASEMSDSYAIRAAVGTELSDSYTLETVMASYPSAAEIAAAVWAHATGADLASRMQVASMILRNKTVTDPVSGTMTVYSDDGVTPALTAQLFENIGETQAYRGQGAEVRGRLS